MRKENNNNIIYSAIILPELPSFAILESTPECNQRCLRSVDSVRILNVNNADYIDYIDVTWTILPMFLLRFCALIKGVGLLSTLVGT